MKPEEEVAVLMGLFNAGPLLAPQLESLRRQSHTAWRLIVSDDGSQDAGPAQVQAFAERQPDHDIRLIKGPGRGFARNFVHLIRAAGPQVPYAAFSDQDDVWLPQKLARAVAALAALPADRPGLYCARTLICDADLTPIAPSPVWHRPFGFANALVQNVAAGNTIVLNRAALDLAQAASVAADAAEILAHDWWLYQIVTGVGGQVIRDPEPVLLYRQHAGNQMGRNDTVAAALLRLRRILRGDFRDWNTRNIAALRPHAGRLTPENRALLAGFAALRRQAAIGRICGLARLGLYRQTHRAGLAMWLAAGLNRL